MVDFDKLNKIISLFELQKIAECFNTYKNEFETIKLFMNVPGVQKSYQDVWNMLMKDSNITFCVSKSIELREQGNKLFKYSPEKHALDASRLYTKAILAAPPGSEALALAHANRAIALQKFGYFQQAYDDCECALEQGYPKNLRQKIIARQASCAEKLGDATLLQKHLESLIALSLNKTYTAQVDKLQQSLEKLKLKETNLKKDEECDKEYRGAHKIAKTASKGRCLIAEKAIKKDELIFTDRAFSFLPANERHICQHCAATQLIPFPCYNCYGKVVYCSLKCRTAHQVTHACECLGYQKGLFASKYHHQALRMVLDGIPKIISYLCQKKTAKDIWNELTCEKSSLMQSNLQYTQALRMIAYLEKETFSDLLISANFALLFTWFLRNQTNFFNLFKKTRVSLGDWQLVIASLMLRHMGQLLINGSMVMEKYHIFRCENCRQNFIAETMDSKVRCTNCHAIQHKLMEKLGFLNEQLNTPSQKMRTAEPLLNAIKAYEDLDQWLLGPHDIKFKMSIKVVEKCFEMNDIGQFNFYSLKRIIKILKFHLRYKIERYHLKTIDYVGPMTYLWDFIALGKYQCNTKEMQEMLQAIEILPDDTKKLFINYYNDYIIGDIK